jgi:6-phosphogluconate dehydrogenase
MVQLGKAGELYNWSLNFEDISAIWRGGCIIRARFLNRITEAYRANPQLKNLMLAPFFRDVLNRTQANWRIAVTAAIDAGVAVPAFSAALAYFDSYRTERLPANLLQAQRDYFGAHTFERIDKPAGEFFHFEWFA